MRMTRIARCMFLLLAVLLLPVNAMAQAANEWLKECDPILVQPVGFIPSIGPGDFYCYSFDEQQTAPRVFFISEGSASICLERDTNATAAGNAAIEVQWCVPKITASDKTCNTLDTIFRESPCPRFTNGVYRLKFITPPLPGETAMVEIRS